MLKPYRKILTFPAGSRLHTRAWTASLKMALPLVKGSSFVGASISMYRHRGRFFITISGSCMSASRCCSSSAKSHPRSQPLAFLKTPCVLATALVASVKRTGKSKTSGKRPGMPDVKRSWNSSHLSFRDSACSEVRFGSFIFGTSWAVIQSSRCWRACANVIARSCCA